MADPAQSRRDSHRIRRPWCCSFGVLPQTPENMNPNVSSSSHSKAPLVRVSRMDPRRILSPGRVSPIDSNPVPEIISPNPVSPEPVVQEEIKNDVCSSTVGAYDVRLSVKGKNGKCLVLELDSGVLSENSSVFANLILDCRKKEEGSGSGSGSFCRIEVPDVENLTVFHETIELMFEEDVTRRLRNMGVSRSIDVLEVAAGIIFTKGVLACLKYIEAVPWSENDEDKLRSLFTKFTFDDTTTRDVLARLSLPEEVDSQQHLALQLVRSVASGNDNNSRSELKSLVKDLFAKSSVYEKDLTCLNKEDLYVVSKSCLSSLVVLFEEASSDLLPEERVKKVDNPKPLIQRISREADSINWLLEILLDQQMAEEFVDVWADQEDLLRMHKMVSPMVRYELSRISAWVFIALGRGKLHCRSETRCRVFQAWFLPMLVDFGWLQRCRKGLEIKELEEAIGQALLTLPMKNQHLLFMDWFRSFSSQGAECPNLSKAFQIWWRRSSKSNGILTLDSR